MADLSFEWDEEKNAANIKNHGIDFLDAALIFENPTMEAVDESRRLRRSKAHRSGVIGRQSAECCLHLEGRKRYSYHQREEGKSA